MKVVTACPICQGVIELINPQLGVTVACPDCGEEWQVVKVQPLELGYAFDMDEEPALEDEEYPR